LAAVLVSAPRARSSAGLALLTALAVAALWAPAGATGEIRVRTLDGDVLARFRSLACGIKRSAGPGEGFSAKARAGAWKLTIRVYRFSGYHRYLIDYGADGNADLFATKGSRTYSNIAKPETGSEPELTVGGSIQFRAGGRRLIIGFPIAYRVDSFQRQVSVVGAAPCRNK
jgi:hypothetical protein